MRSRKTRPGSRRVDEPRQMDLLDWLKPGFRSSGDQPDDRADKAQTLGGDDVANTIKEAGYGHEKT